MGVNWEIYNRCVGSLRHVLSWTWNLFRRRALWVVWQQSEENWPIKVLVRGFLKMQKITRKRQFLPRVPIFPPGLLGAKLPAVYPFIVFAQWQHCLIEGWPLCSERVCVLCVCVCVCVLCVCVWMCVVCMCVTVRKHEGFCSSSCEYHQDARKLARWLAEIGTYD